MVLARYVRLAVLGTALLASHAQATFQFPPCVNNCITSSGCDVSSARCMCKEARGLLLDSVISCLFFNCKSDLRNFEGAFLEPIEEGCDDSNRDIPRAKLKAAESLASSYIEKLPGLTTVKSATAKATPTPTPSTTANPTPAKLTSSSTTDEESSSTSTADEDVEESTSAAQETTAAPTRVAVPTSSTEPLATTITSPESDSGGGGFDTNPFGSPGSAGWAIRPLASLLALPFAVGVLALR